MKEMQIKTSFNGGCQEVFPAITLPHCAHIHSSVFLVCIAFSVQFQIKYVYLFNCKTSQTGTVSYI